jgi:hypothetical protein
LLDYIFEPRGSAPLRKPVTVPGFSYFYPFGIAVEGEVIFYPAAYPLRGLYKNVSFCPTPVSIDYGFESLSDFANTFANTLVLNPWISAFPAILRNVTPVLVEGKLCVSDTDGKYIPIIASENSFIKMLAYSSGNFIQLFGEWENQKFRPLCLRLPNENQTILELRYID